MYHDTNLDIEALHARINAAHDDDVPQIKPRGRIASLLMKLSYGIGLHERLVEAGLARGWFETFRQYWSEELKGRPLRLHDFFYLHGHYRARFQDVEVADDAAAGEFLAARQRPESVYLLFAAIYKYALVPFVYWPFRKHLKPNDTILEYGCGVAPVTTSMILDGYRNNFIIADIRQINFHYAKWLCRQSTNRVQAIDINPGHPLDLPGSFDVACVLTVMEHLPDPLQTVTAVTAGLRPGGRLIFDYILGDGGGLDTRAAILQRKAVLDFIADRFDVLHGRLDLNASMGLTVARLKP